MTSQPTPTPEEWVVKERKIVPHARDLYNLNGLHIMPYGCNPRKGVSKSGCEGEKAGKILHDMNNLDRHFESFGFSVSWLELAG